MKPFVLDAIDSRRSFAFSLSFSIFVDALASGGGFRLGLSLFPRGYGIRTLWRECGLNISTLVH